MMKRIVSVGILLGLILLGCSVVQVGGNENTYFPRAEGNKWVYEVEGCEGDYYYVTAKMVEITTGTFVWFMDDDAGENSSMLVETEDNTDPLNDSTQYVVDSALGINAGYHKSPNKPYIEPDNMAQRSILFSDDNTDPLNDSTEAVVDSALGIAGISPLFILKEDSHGAVVLDAITTAVGSFSEYLHLEESYTEDVRYDAWLVPNIGPVEVHQWTDNEVVKRFRLVEFIPAES